MNLSALFPPTLIGRLLDDLGAIADATRVLPRLERELLMRLDALHAELGAVRELPAVRTAVESLPGQIDDLATGRPIRSCPRSDGGRAAARKDRRPCGQVEPLQQLPDVHREIASLHAVVDGMSRQLESLEAVTTGIEPLHEDMRAVRDSVDTLEPLLREVNSRLGGLETRLEALREDLAPVGELAEKVPGIG